MPAELFTMPSRAADANGLPYSGALAYFYATGTTTLQSVYTTSALSVAHANPVVADAGGKFANIYMDPALSYRCVIKNSTGSVTLHDIDPINSGAGFFIQSQSGAVSRTVQDRLRDSVHAFDFIPTAKHAGIIARSNTDDLSSYLQDALDTGQLVRLPDIGTMWIADSLQVPAGGGLVGTPSTTIKAKANFGDKALIHNATDNPQTLGARDVGIVIDGGFVIDGNKDNNATGTEFSHGIHLFAVDGVWLNVTVQECKGDGVLISYSRDIQEVGTIHPEIGCSNVNGYIRTLGAARQGVAITCCDGFDLSIYAYQSDLFGLDVEPDNETSYVRNGHVRLQAVECGQSGVFNGGMAVTGTNSTATAAADVSNIVFDVQINDCLSDAGIVWRDVVNITFRGSITGQTGYGLYGTSGSFSSSRVTIDCTIVSANGGGIRDEAATQLFGNVVIDSVTGDGVYIANGNGSRLTAKVRAASSEGIVLHNCTNVSMPDSVVETCTSHGVQLTGSTSGCRFPNLKSSGSTEGWGFREENTANDNRATDARMSSNSSGNVSLVGAASLVQFEPLFGKATYDAASIADGDHATSTVTVTGAAVGDEAQVTFGVSLAGLTLSAYVSAANTVTFVLNNQTGGAVDLASTTVKAYVTPRSMA